MCADFLDFSGMMSEGGRNRRKSSNRTRRGYSTRLAYWRDKKGLPVELAEYLAKEGFLIRPSNQKDRRVKEIIEEDIELFWEMVEEYQKSKRTRKQAIRKALNWLKAKNKEYSEESFKLFTIKSP